MSDTDVFHINNFNPMFQNTTQWQKYSGVDRWQNQKYLVRENIDMWIKINVHDKEYQRKMDWWRYSQHTAYLNLELP